MHDWIALAMHILLSHLKSFEVLGEHTVTSFTIDEPMNE